MNRKGATKNKVPIWVVIVMIALVAVAGYKWDFIKAKVSGSSSTLSVVNPTDTSTGQQTLTFVQPSVTATPHDPYNGSTQTGTLTLFVAGVKSSGSAGTAFNVPAGATWEALFDDGQHYMGQATGTGPANGNVPTDIDMIPNGTLSSTFYNSAGTAATAQAMTPNDLKYVKVLLTSQNKQAFSNPDSDKNPIICFDYPTAEYDTIEVVGSTPAPIPQQAVGTYEECDYAPFKSLADGQEQTLQILVDADDTVNPTNDSTMIVYDQDRYIKTKLPVDARVFNVENDAGTDIGGINPTVTLDFS